MGRGILKAVMAAAMLSVSSLSVAGGGPLGIDKVVEKDDGGIWKYHYDMPTAIFAGVAAAAVIEGSESRLGKAAWHSLSAFAAAQLATEGLKAATGRVRPINSGGDPNLWGVKGNKSFVSGHVAGTAALVTPIIMEYKDTHPEVWALAALVPYQMVGRVKAQAHWQTDVLAGAAVGVAAGYFMSKMDTPLLIAPIPGGVFIGLRHAF